MRHIMAFSLLFAAMPVAASDTVRWIDTGKTGGFLRYYFIMTNKDFGDGEKSSAHAHSIGGTFSHETADIYGLKAGATLMTSQPFALPDVVDTSVAGKNNGARGKDPHLGYSVLGEAYASYQYDVVGLWYGRKAINTPLIHTKDVQMLPSTVQGAWLQANIDVLTVQAGYLDAFKQRSSDAFVNILEHALGKEMQIITNDTHGYVVPMALIIRNDTYHIRYYNYFVSNFMDAVYFDGRYTFDFEGINASVFAQYIRQGTIGHAKTNLEHNTSVTGGKTIDVTAYAFKAELNMGDTTLNAAYSHVLRNPKHYDSLVLPWDGTPLYTNQITANTLFQSIYGRAFTSDSAYIGGTHALRLGAKQRLEPLGIDGAALALSGAVYRNTRPGYGYDQYDLNVVTSYAFDSFSLAGKGIFVRNNTSSDALGNVSQIDNFTQYRIIFNYQF